MNTTNFIAVSGAKSSLLNFLKRDSRWRQKFSGSAWSRAALGFLLSTAGGLTAATTGFNQTGAGPYDYNTTANWVGSTINGTWDTSLTLAAAQTATFAADTTLTTGLTFNYAGNFGLTLDSSSTTAHTLTLGGDISLNTGGGTSANVIIGDATDPLNVALGATRNITVTPSGNSLTIVNPISGSTFGITKAGSGTLTLSGANTFSGATTVSTGTLQLQNASALASSALTLASGTTLSLQADVDTTFAPASLTAFTVGNTYNFQVNSLNSPAGNGHTLTLTGQGGGSTGNNTTANTINVSSTTGDTLKFGTSAFHLSGGSGSAWGGNNNNFNLTGANVILTGMDDSAGNGDVVLVLASTTGNTLTINGAVACNASRTIGATVNSGVLILNNGVSQSGSNNHGFWVNLVGGILNVNNAGAINNNHTPGFTISGGTLDNTSGTDLTLSANPAIAFNGDFTFTGTYSLNLGTGAATLGANRQITVNAKTLTVGGAVSGGFSLTKAGSGTLALTGASTYTGGTTLSAGQLNINYGGSSSANSAIGTGALTISGGTIDNTSAGDVTLLPNNTQLWNGDFTYAGSVPHNLNLGTGAVTLGATPQVTVTAGTLTVGGAIGGSSYGLTKAGSGTLTLSGVNTYGGDTTINASGGILTIGSAGQLGSGSYAGNISIGSGAAFNYNSSAAQTLSGVISGGGALTNGGSGTLTLSGDNSYTGGTTVSAGTLILSGNNTSATGGVTNSSTLQLQHASAVAGSALTLNNGSTLNLRADADTTFTAASIANIGGTVTMNVDQVTSGGGNGGKKLTLNNNFSMNAGSTLNVTAGSDDTLALGTNSISAGGSTETISAAAGAKATLAGVQASGVYDTMGFSGAGNIDVLGAMQENSGSRWLALQFNQTGTVTLWAANSLRLDNGGTLGNAAYHPTISFNSGVTVLNNSGAFNMNSYFGSIIYLGAGSGTSAAMVLLGGTDSSGLAGGITMTPPIWSGANNGTIGVRDTTSGTLTVGGQNTSGVNAWGCNFTLGSSANTGKSLTLLAATGGEVDFTGNLLANGSDTTAGITVGDATHGGTVKITGANTYLGGTTVNGGKLAVSSALTGTTATGVITVNDGSTLQATVSGTSQLTPSTLTVGSSSGATLEFANISSTTTPPINPATLNITGTVTINIDSIVMTTGTYPLVTNYTAGTVALGALPARVNAHLSTAGNQISLVVDSITPDTWVAGTGNWDTSLQNWKTNGVSMTYADGDPVLFDDTAPGSVTITPSTVSPDGVTVNNTGNNNYTIAGGGIAGTGALTKSGNSTLTLLNTNTYTGGTTISAGTVQLGDGSVNNGVVAGGITDNANLVIANPLDQTITNTTSGSGNVTKTGAGTLTVSGANTFSGITTIKQGAVSFSNGSNLSTNTVVLGDATTGAGATLQLNAGATVTNSLTVASGAGARTLSTVGGSTFSGGTVTLNNNLTLVKTTSTDSHLSDALSGTGSVIVTNYGGGILWLDGPRSPNWTGAFIIQAGTVRPGTSGNQFTTNTVLSISANNGANFNVGGLNADLYFAGLNDIPGTTGGGIGGGSSAHNVVLGGSGNYTYSGTFNSATWGLTVNLTDSGKQTFTGTNTYPGSTTIRSGTLAVSGNGSIATTPIVAIAANAIFDVSAITPGSYTNPAARTLAFNIDKTGSILTQGQLILGTKNLTYGGALTVSATGDALANGDSFPLVTTSGGTFSGWFSSVSVPTLASGISWDTNKLATSGVLDIYNFTTTPLSLSTPENTNAVIAALKLANHVSSERAANAYPTGWTVAVTTQATNGMALVDGSGILTYSPNANYVGPDNFTLTLQDGHGWQTMAVSVTVGTGTGLSPNVLSQGMTNIDSVNYYYVNFAGIPGYTYTVETNSIVGRGWTKETNITATATGAIQVLDPMGSGSLYYRTVWPSY